MIDCYKMTGKLVQSTNCNNKIEKKIYIEITIYVLFIR